MRSFIRMSVAVLALFVVANVATAQGGGGGGGGGQGRGGPPGQRTADRLLTGITLTADQTAKVAPVVKWYDEEFAKLPPMGRGGDMDSTAMAAARAARTKLSTEFQGKLKELLTPEQVKTFEANVAAAAARGGRRGGGE